MKWNYAVLNDEAKTAKETFQVYTESRVSIMTQLMQIHRH